MVRALLSAEEIPDYRRPLSAQGTRDRWQPGDNSRGGVPNVLAHSTANSYGRCTYRSVSVLPGLASFVDVPVNTTWKAGHR
jgi:hypothetical protein